ncbi:MAG: AbrB family transcriptional regulator, partial [Geminicoccaceae bacterium]
MRRPWAGWRLSGRRPALRDLLLAVGISLLGGAVFYYLALPLPWMLGAALFATVAAISGAPVAIPSGLRNLMLIVLGVLLGSSFTHDVLENAMRWLVSLCGIPVYIIVVTGIVCAALRRFAGYDPVTAYFAGTPGGLVQMTLIGGAMGGDDRTIALTHALRIVIIVFVVAFGFRLLAGYAPQKGGASYVPFSAVAPLDLLLLTACGVLGAVLGRWLRLPASELLGPMLLSGAIHLAGLTATRPPSVLVAAAQVIVGGAIGCRFAGISLTQILRTMAAALGASAMMLTATLAFSAVLSALAGLPFPALVLAFTPGGLAEMAVIALALGIDTAFVTTHNIGRVLGVLLL